MKKLYNYLFLCAIFVSHGIAGAQTAAPGSAGWPSRPIRFIVPFPPGGGTDVNARIIAPRLAAALGQQVVVENRTGAGGMVGTEVVAKSAPDGYSMVIATIGPIAINPSLYAKMTYDPAKDLAPVTITGEVPNGLVVHPTLPAKTPREFVTLARANPGKLVYASTGIGGLTHMATELMANMAGLKMIHVPYKSTGMAMPEIMAGQIQVMVAGMLAAQPFFANGRLRPLGVTTAKRWPSLPNLPAIAEAVPGYDTGTYYGMFLPKGTPAGIATRLNAEVNKILQDGGIKNTLEAQGMAASGGTSSAFAARVKKEYDDWVKVVREAKLKIE